jgi:hypothetical protein
VKDPVDYLLLIQREYADDTRPDFIFDQRDESLLQEREKERDAAILAERERSARVLRNQQQASTNPL